MRTHPSSIFTYFDYRKFLADFYNYNKTNTTGFSYRVMSECLGFTSPNFIKLIIDGERNLGKESLEKITQGLGLSKLEAEYFSYLVFFAQAKNNIDKNYYFGLLASLRSNTTITKVSPEQYEYFSEWYHPAIRELVTGRSAPLDYEELSTMLNEKLTAFQIKKSVELLLRLKLIFVNKSNQYEHTATILNTENEFKTFAIRHYHKQVLEVASSAIDTIPPEQRENSHVTLKISENGFSKIKQRIQEFREELLQIASSDAGVTDIVHVNLQLYPITKSKKNDTLG
jgi:uncharacterized protein (TIGR02147 family)